VQRHRLAKNDILDGESEFDVAVVPAKYKVNLDRVGQALKTNNIKLADEAAFSHRFEDCEVGAMPPFGRLYGMDVYVAESLSEDDKIAFNAGSHLEVIQMAYKDYETLAKPSFIFLDN